MTGKLDDAFRTTSRLQVAAFLSGCDEAEFKAVQRHCDLSPSNLSKQAAALEELGYAAVRKGYVGKTPRTWLALTEDGRRALADHLAALQEIAANAARHAG
jgi:DNA-binding MarR family transcriptional regulator